MTTFWRSIGISFLTLGITLPDTSANPELNSIVSSQNYSTQYSRWPAAFADTRTSKLEVSVVPGYAYGLSVQENERVMYLSQAAIWIGGIIGYDTLVSTSGWAQTILNGAIDGNSELLSKGYPQIQRAVLPVRTPGFTTYQVELNDERRENLGYWQWDAFRRNHVPLHVVVSQRVHVKNDFPFKGISLLDFTIRNNGTFPVREAWVGMYFDGDAGVDGTSWYYDDDLIGSLRDIHTAYVMDNDGDPTGAVDNPVISVPHAVGIRPVYSSQAATDTNFNWWLNVDYGASYDFAPRLRGTPADPFRDFNADYYGQPQGDINRYYMLRHKEWDYDQVMSQLFGSDDPVWNPAPDGVDLRATSIGSDTKGLLSIGPFELMPDSSIRVIFAVFVGDLVHLDWQGGRDLAHGNFQEFYRKLNFKMLRRAAEDAVGMVDALLDPMVPPLDFKVQRTDADSAWFSWESACYPDVTGYALYIRPATQDELLNPSTVLPIAEKNNWDNATRVMIPAGKHSVHVTDLIPGRPYIAALAHVTNRGEGEKTDPIVLGTSNESLIPSPPEFDRDFLHFSKSDSRVTLRWQASADSSVSYYKIYKAEDSLTAAKRYSPFWSDDSSLVPYPATHTASTSDGEYWYYEMKAYDSVSRSVTSYTDIAPDSVAYYWITAVSQPGFESEFSSTLQAEQVPAATRDILLVYGSPRSDDDYIVDQNVQRRLEDILGDYLFDIYNWSDTNYYDDQCPDHFCVNWTDLARYDLIIFQEYPQSVLLSQISDPAHRLLTRLLESGRTVAYFGSPPGKRKLSISTLDTLIVYDSANVASSVFGVDSLTLQSWAAVYNTFGAIDSLAGFVGGHPVHGDWPRISIDSPKDKVRGLFTRIFKADSVLPFVPAFYPNDETKVLYAYESGYQSSSRLHGLPCGVSSERSGFATYAFSFPLWSLDVKSGQALVDRLMQEVDQIQRQPAAPIRSLPNRFTLNTNYPNPFNSSTTISFDLISAQHISLDIFSVRGARVRSLIGEQSFAPGLHRVTWDGKNDDGRDVASGIYFYRLHTGAGDAVRRMTLIK